MTSSEIKRGVALCHYDRANNLQEIIQAVRDTVPEGTKIVVCDDGSESLDVDKICYEEKVVLIKGPNMGVAYNKNRALWALQDCHFLCILEDDLKPIQKGWFEVYENAAKLSGIHHFCRVQNKEIPETLTKFSEFMQPQGLTPLYGPSPRGDITFITSKVITVVGGFNPEFMGVGYAHGEWSERCVKADLIPHPLKYVDIKEARDSFVQIGDTEGGRWTRPKEEVAAETQRNRQTLKKLQKTGYIYHPLVLR